MSLGTRFRSCTEATSLKTSISAALIGVAILGGSMGAAVAQEASPEASPVAVASWLPQVPQEAEFTFDGDRASVGVVLGEVAEINVAAIESRPYIILQTDNQTDVTQNVGVFMVPEGFDATTFTMPASEADLPEGVTGIAGYSVDAGTQSSPVFADLAVGSYALVTDGGLVVPFAVTEAAEIDVPDIFETPEDEGTPAA